MDDIAFVFPGQGSQHPGMGLDLYETNDAARKVFAAAEECLTGILDTIFSSTAEELMKTGNTQPAVFCVELAAAAALTEAGITPGMLAGFSLGEVTALTYSGAVTYPEGFRMVALRARLMQKASETCASPMSMAAVLALDDRTVESVCREFKNVFPVNYNCPGQVAVSGPADELSRLSQRVREMSGRVIPLKVGGAFHSPSMTDAAVGFLSELASFDIRTPAIPLYSNMTAEPYGGDLAALLAGQICAPVLWSRTILNMIKAGVRTFIEVGPGKVLSGLITRISTDVKVLNVCDAASLAEAAAALNEAEAAAELNEAEAAAALNEAEAAAALRGGRRVAKG